MGETTERRVRRALVLGGTGLLGRHVCAAFAERGVEVVSVSRTAATSTEWRSIALNLAGTAPDRIADLLDEIGADVVVNCAGAVWRPTDEQMRVANVELVAQLTGVLTTTRRRPRLVHMGTIHEYGPGIEGEPISEKQPAAPVTGYGTSKLRGTEAVLDAVRDDGLDAVILRASNSTGPGLPRASLLGGIAGQLADHARGPGGRMHPLELCLSPLRVQRDFVDIRDIAAAVVAAATVPDIGVPGEIINIGGGRAVPVRDMVDRLIALSALSVNVTEQPESGTGRNDVAWQQLDIDKARRMLSWQPCLDLDMSLSDMLTNA